MKVCKGLKWVRQEAFQFLEAWLWVPTTLLPGFDCDSCEAQREAILGHIAHLFAYVFDG